MAYLADTNAASRRVLPADAQHAVVSQAIDLLRQQGKILYILTMNPTHFRCFAGITVVEPKDVLRVVMP